MVIDLTTRFEYSPYNLVPMRCGTQATWGRPVGFDSDVADQHTMRNMDGELVKPAQLAVACPDCGAGSVVDVVLSDPPFDDVVYVCAQCHPPPPALIDPFVNPVDTGRVLTYEINAALLPPVTQTVAERLGRVVVSPVAPEAIVTPPQADVPSVTEKARKAPPKQPKKVKPQTPDQPEMLPRLDPIPDDVVVDTPHDSVPDGVVHESVLAAVASAPDWKFAAPHVPELADPELGSEEHCEE